MPDFSRYQPPGVYVEGTTDTVVTTNGVPTTTVTLVGVARGYQIHTQTVGIGSTAVTLAKTGVLPDSDSSPDLVVTKADGTVLVEGTDYTLQRGSGPAASTTITRQPNSSAVGIGEQVTVSFSYTDPFYFTPRAFADYTSIEQTYGPSMLSDAAAGANQVGSPLSLATRIAFENGASSVICLPVEPPTTGGNAKTLRDQFNSAYAKIANDYATSILVPVFAQGSLSGASYTSGLQGFISDAKVHVEAQKTAGYGRIAVFGADTGYSDLDTSFDEMAAATTSEEVVLAYPNRLNFFNQATGQTTEVGGCYLAAAYAGRLAFSPVNRGLTQQQVYGFSGIPSDLRQKMTLDFKNRLSAAGVAVTEISRGNSLRVRHGVTTNTSSLTSSEVSIVRQGHVLFQMIWDGVQASDLIGDPIDSEMTMRIKGIITGILETAKAENVIRDYPSLVVRQQSLPSGDPTAIECVFTWQPFLPLNYITVGFSMDLTTGDITTDDSLVAA